MGRIFYDNGFVNGFLNYKGKKYTGILKEKNRYHLSGETIQKIKKLLLTIAETDSEKIHINNIIKEIESEEQE